MPPTLPHVILICTDDQGYGDIACHGNPQTHTPHLDAMARASTQLDNHHTDPLCSPSRAALMTGRYAARGGVWHVTQGRHLLDAARYYSGRLLCARLDRVDCWLSHRHVRQMAPGR